MTATEALKLDRSEVNVLDWGCGRGRSVAKLRELGFNAYGVEIDEKTMRNGFQLFQRRGLNASEVLRHLSEISCFSDEYFHFVFFEQVFEHVADLGSVVKELARLTTIGGVGVHNFPSAKCVREDHLCMPFVHWLPKNRLRKAAIRLMVAMGKAPVPDWPEASGKTANERAEVYFDYSIRNTFYRDIRTIIRLFASAGFEAAETVRDLPGHWKQLIPEYLYRNGFPDRDTTLITKRIGRLGSGQKNELGESTSIPAEA